MQEYSIIMYIQGEIYRCYKKQYSGLFNGRRIWCENSSRCSGINIVRHLFVHTVSAKYINAYIPCLCCVNNIELCFTWMVLWAEPSTAADLLWMSARPCWQEVCRGTGGRVSCRGGKRTLVSGDDRCVYVWEQNVTRCWFSLIQLNFFLFVGFQSFFLKSNHGDVTHANANPNANPTANANANLTQNPAEL